MGERASESFFESPHAVTYLLILMSSAMFALTLFGNSLARIDSTTLYHYGALYKPALARHEYWRLIAYAFLHGDIIHLGLNMLCIGAWAGILEKRIGAAYFIAVYLASAVGGGFASIYGHGDNFLSVGSSGAISGIVGALLCLTILGKLGLSPQFFAIVIGLNVLFSANVAHVDWHAHLGGFTAGFAACAVIDAAENASRYWLRCKFPEFVKSGIAAAFIGAALLYFQWAGDNDQDAGLAVLAAAIPVLAAAVKLTDIVLARPKGFAASVIATAALWGFLAYAAGSMAISASSSYCLRSSLHPGGSSFLSAIACEHAALWLVLLAAAGFFAALFLLRTELRRGLNDAGFIAVGLAAERKRRQGL